MRGDIPDLNPERISVAQFVCLLAIEEETFINV